MKLVSYMLATALSISTTSPVVAKNCKTIVEILKADDRFTTLVAAVTAAGLVDTLSGDGPVICCWGTYVRSYLLLPLLMFPLHSCVAFLLIKIRLRSRFWLRSRFSGDFITY